MNTVTKILPPPRTYRCWVKVPHREPSELLVFPNPRGRDNDLLWEDGGRLSERLTLTFRQESDKDTT